MRPECQTLQTRHFYHFLYRRGLKFFGAALVQTETKKLLTNFCFGFLEEEEDQAARISLRRPLGKFNCLLCFDDFDNEEDGILLHCAHATCKDCFKHFAGIAVQNTDFLRCPSCAEPVSSGEVAYLCDQSIAERYVPDRFRE
jgi:hypothetical protein